jgi:uncharacterized membrane protein
VSWLILSLISAFCISLRQVQEKRLLEEGVDPYLLFWLVCSCTVLILFPFAYFSGIPQLNVKFWLTLAMSSIANIVATILGLVALKYSDISLTVPMLAFTPAFMLPIGYLILGEFPNYQGTSGVLLIVFGAYFLNVNDRRKGWFAPFSSLFNNRGTLLMLMAAFVLSICACIDKIGVQISSPWFWGWATQFCIWLMLSPIILRWKIILLLREIGGHYRRLVIIGLLASVSAIVGLYAITLTLAAYMIAVKRSSILISVTLGHYLFREQGIRERMVGATTMLTGIALITLQGTIL